MSVQTHGSRRGLPGSQAITWVIHVPSGLVSRRAKNSDMPPLVGISTVSVASASAATWLTVPGCTRSAS